MTTRFDQVFASLPKDIRDRLSRHYHEIKHNFALRKSEPSELNGAKFCEDVYRLLEWHTSTTNIYTQYGKQLRNFRGSVLQWENDTSLDDAIRMHIPDVLRTIYDIRNKRGVTHSPGEISPNLIDASLVVSCADWVMAELVRLFYNSNLDEDEARDMVESLVTKRIPLIWQIDDRKRVISPPGKKLSDKKKALALLYSDHPKPLMIHILVDWTDSTNESRLQNQYLPALHKAGLIDIDEATELVRLSPLDVAYVEAKIPLEYDYS